MSLLVVLSACQQVDQTLPFELDLSGGATITVNSGGGVVSLPPSVSLEFPSGSYSGSVTITPMDAGLFPGDAGLVLAGTAYDITPGDGVLSLPARLDLKVPPQLLAIGDEVRLSVALQRDDGSVATFNASYDLTNEILSAHIDELGPVAAVILADAIPVDLGAEPPLAGGGFPVPAPPPGQVGPALAHAGGLQFDASCSPALRRCFSSGLIRVYVDNVVRQRLGDRLFLVSATVDAELHFFDYLLGVPQQVEGRISIGGELRARINSVITADDVSEVETTGPGTPELPTALTISSTDLVMAETSDGFNTTFRYGIDGIGTSEMLTIRMEGEIEFDNDDGSTDIGLVIAHIRLRS